MPDPKLPDERLQHEFNRWAEEGRGEEMERHHISIAEQTLQLGRFGYWTFRSACSGRHQDVLFR